VNVYDSLLLQKYQIFSPTAEGFLSENASDHTAHLGKAIFVQATNTNIGTSTALVCLVPCDFSNLPEIKNLIQRVSYLEQRDHSVGDAFRR
jgi:hypothetical protein